MAKKNYFIGPDFTIRQYEDLTEQHVTDEVPQVPFSLNNGAPYALRLRNTPGGSSTSTGRTGSTSTPVEDDGIDGTIILEASSDPFFFYLGTEDEDIIGLE
jgi:hypothetical protein